VCNNVWSVLKPKTHQMPWRHHLGRYILHPTERQKQLSPTYTWSKILFTQSMQVAMWDCYYSFLLKEICTQTQETHRYDVSTQAVCSVSALNDCTQLRITHAGLLTSGAHRTYTHEDICENGVMWIGTQSETLSVSDWWCHLVQCPLWWCQHQQESALQPSLQWPHCQPTKHKWISKY